MSKQPDRQSVYKYPISFQRDVRVMMPEGARLVKAGLDSDEVPCIWALVDASVPPRVERKFGIYGTGGTVPGRCIYVDTFFSMPFVWHVFEEPVEQDA